MEFYRIISKLDTLQYTFSFEDDNERDEKSQEKVCKMWLANEEGIDNNMRKNEKPRRKERKKKVRQGNRWEKR